jgi:hypothetical protein
VGIVVPGSGVIGANASHAPIVILSDADFAACNRVTGGLADGSMLIVAHRSNRSART